MNRKEHSARQLLAGRTSRPASTKELAAKARRLYEEGDPGSSQKVCKELLAQVPSHVEALNLLGLMAQDSARHAKAIKFFNKAIDANPSNAACHYNLGSSYEALNDRRKASAHFKEALALGLSGKDAGQLVTQGKTVAACLERIRAAWPKRPSPAELFGPPGIAVVANDVFLCCALETARLNGLLLERFLTDVRRALLQIAIDTAPDFFGVDDAIVRLGSALAQQYYRNEYVYAESAEETRAVTPLRELLQDKLQSASTIHPVLVVIVAAYGPLHALPCAEQLTGTTWPDVLADVVRQQILEPLEEAQDRATIPSLTPIAEQSAPVRRMYEENPYPRWTMVTKDALPDSQASIGASSSGTTEILVAGCGTGSKAIITALFYPSAKVLAVDVSLASLAYARRKGREANVRNIEFAQADIMNLGLLGRTFDRIECIGVLHHLKDPLAGWRILLSMLRPGGTMVVGLYSATARKGINAARAFVADRGSRPTPEGIRACRQELIRHEALRQELDSINDFFTMSECRDLLFHVMEHQFTIAQIKAFIVEQRLSFLGFYLDQVHLDRFQQQIASPDALLDLDRWDRFEASNPRTFIQTYLFAVRSSGKPPDSPAIRGL